MTDKLRKVKIPELNDAYRRTMIWFFSFPTTETSLSDLSKEINISKTTANRVICRLSDEGFLEVKELGRVWRIKSIQKHPYNYTIKVAYNLEMIYSSGIIDEIRKVSGNPVAILLFGSYRKGDDLESSDIDIAAEVIGNEKMKVIEMGTFPEFGFRKNVKVNLHIFSRKQIDLNLFSNIANGIVLDGFLEAKP